MDHEVKLVLCDCCGVERVAVPASFLGQDFVWCESCGGDLAAAGSCEVVDAERFASDELDERGAA